MGRPRLPASLAFLLSLRLLLSCESASYDIPAARLASDTCSPLGHNPPSLILLPGSFAEDAPTGKDGRSAAESGKKAGGGGSSASTPPLSLSSSSPSSAASPAAVLSSSSSSLTASAAAGGALYNESKEAMSCPASCFRANPVCGVDGVTYWCGSADAECAGVEVEYVGFCDFGSRGTGGKGVLAVQSLLLVHMIWLMLAAFLVLLGVP